MAKEKEFDAFRAEAAILEHAEALSATSAASIDRSEYDVLVKAYRKLLKSSQRLTRLSDRNEERIKEAGNRIELQQAELEMAHRKLSQHADMLEERVKERTKELVATQERLQKLVELGIALSRERRHGRFIEMILDGAKALTNSDGGCLLLRTEDDRMAYELLTVDSLDLRLGGSSGRSIPYSAVALRDVVSGRPNYFDPTAHAVLTERLINIADVSASKEFDFADAHRFDADQGYRTQSLLVVPLKPRQGQVIGVLFLSNARKRAGGPITAFTPAMAEFVEALSSQAAAALDNQNLMKAQTALYDAVIKVIAGAIDAKSPYTGGHCERVPELAAMLARAACNAEDGPFADFSLDEDQWREFHLAGWLHDCGKVTTPEYVVDKASKLETIYNRIHEVRARFEIKLRDYKIEQLQAALDGGVPVETFKEEFDRRIAALYDDFAFVASCNVGEEFMDKDKVERLERIAQIPWRRHFDDRLGMSEVERIHLSNIPPRPLPVDETLLIDKPEHVIPRPVGAEPPYDMARYGFNIKAPQHLYNRGELYNLKIARGTLTEEERFKINEHIIYTIIMLEQLPFPRSMARVAEFAGSHHETMIGSGYPRKLKRDDMAVQARILAIADIFEALTASDRPYKKAKTLSESLKIMNFMRKDQHIDADLFDLFIRSGVYQEYALRYLKKSQIDLVDRRSCFRRSF
ncbi:GAF domain-containing protein [Azospirillaceae bacterium]